MKRFFIFIFLFLFFAIYLNSETLINFYNTMRQDTYTVKGDKKSGTYNYTGPQRYDEFNLNIDYKRSNFNIFKGELSGVINDSDYRASDNGFIVERWRIFNENGEFALPYRAELGDYMGFFTYRTLQTSLKGTQIEVQPQSEKLSQSIIFLIGSPQGTWKDFHPKRNYTIGGSYLILPQRDLKIGLNAIYTRVKEGDSSSHLYHRVYSINGEKEIKFMENSILFEGEFSYYKGDISLEKERDAVGIFFQLTGKRKGINYRLRYEDYGEYYEPPNASVPKDRRSYEAHFGLNLKRGIYLRLRWQHYQNNIYSSNRTDETVYGFNTGGTLPGRININFDTFYKTNKDIDGNNDSEIVSASLNLNKSLTERINARISTNISHTHNPSSSPSEQRSLNGGIDYSLNIGKASLTLSPNLGLQYEKSPGTRNKIVLAGLNINLSGGRHSLSSGFNMEFQKQRPSEDLVTTSWNMIYEYRLNRSTFGMELDSNYRNPRESMGSESYKLSFYWRFNFSKKFTYKKQEKKQEILPMTLEREYLIAKLPLDISVYEAEELIERYGIKEGVKQGNNIIYEVKWYEEIDNRQRFVIALENDKVKEYGIIIDYTQGETPDNMRNTFEYLKQILLKRYGNPSKFYEKGEWKNIKIELNKREFVRNYEWILPDGILRFGIPRRTDRKIRIEIHFAKQFPPIEDAHWGFDDIY